MPISRPDIALPFGERRAHPRYQPTKDLIATISYETRSPDGDGQAMIGVSVTIATAPKDGTTVVVWSPTRGTFAAWNKGHGWRTEPGVYACRPTHWMPLPDPPKEPQ